MSRSQRRLRTSRGGRLARQARHLLDFFVRHSGLKLVATPVGNNSDGLGEKVMSVASRISAISRLFSSGVFREMARKGRSPLFARLIGQAEVTDLCPRGAKVGDAFDSAFSVLRTAGLRDEYVYRAALTEKVLLGTHSLKTACMLTEFRVGACKADLVILNGTATVYEIKSERDSLSRLARQVENYKKVFARVYVIAGENHIRSVIETTPEDVGVLCLSPRYQRSTIREAIDRPDRICTTTVFESLRLTEARAILLELGSVIPDVPNTLLHTAMRSAFAQLRPEDVHFSMVKTLKRTRDLAPLGRLVERLPSSLQAAALSIPVRRGDHARLIEAIETPLDAAMAWI